MSIRFVVVVALVALVVVVVVEYLSILRHSVHDARSKTHPRSQGLFPTPPPWERGCHRKRSRPTPFPDFTGRGRCAAAKQDT